MMKRVFRIGGLQRETAAADEHHRRHGSSAGYPKNVAAVHLTFMAFRMKIEN
jgi:hypothetical protein